MTRVHVTDVAGAYDAWAPHYDVDGNPLVAIDDQVLPALYADPRAAPLAQMRVLDLGCGTGRHTARLVAAGAYVTGVDASAGMLARARERLGDVDRVTLVQHGDLARLPLLRGSFDRAVCALVLEHVADLAPVFRELARVVKPGGLVVVSDIHPRMRAVTQANFTDPHSGHDVLPPSFAHGVDDFVSAARAANISLQRLLEVAGTPQLAQRAPRAAKYLGVPMLVALVGRVERSGAST